MLRNNRHFDQSAAHGILVKSTPPLKMIRGVIKLVLKFNYAAKPWYRQTWWWRDFRTLIPQIMEFSSEWTNATSATLLY